MANSTEEQRVVAYRVGQLLIGARNPEEAVEGYRLYTGERTDSVPEPEPADASAPWPPDGSTRLTIGSLLEEALAEKPNPPLWLASFEDLQ